MPVDMCMYLCKHGRRCDKIFNDEACAGEMRNTSNCLPICIFRTRMLGSVYSGLPFQSGCFNTCTPMISLRQLSGTKIMFLWFYLHHSWLENPHFQTSASIWAFLFLQQGTCGQVCLDVPRLQWQNKLNDSMFHRNTVHNSAIKDGLESVG